MTRAALVLLALAGTARADPPAAVGTATPPSLGGGGETTQLLATVTAGTLPDSTGLHVSCDLALIGDDATTLHDDGLHGDGAAADLVFGLVSITGDQIPFGDRDLPCLVSDDQARSAVFTIAVTIVPVCGDGLVTDGETCDDYGTESGDGCDDLCVAEVGWHCAGEPSDCAPRCGDGVLVSDEECDDGGHATGDGCNSTCALELGWACEGAPSACVEVPYCGDGSIDPGEACDDGYPEGDDGCDGTCSIDPDYTCAGEPSICTDAGGRAPHDQDGDGVHDDLDPCPADPDDLCDEPEPEEDPGCCSAGGDGSLLLALLVLAEMRTRRPRGRLARAR